jgi:nitroreductase
VTVPRDDPPARAVLEAIRSRRSVGRVRPDPLPRELVEELIGAAVCAPNHHLTGPWRFVVLAGPARREVGEAHLRAVLRERPDLPPQGVEKEASRLERAPVVVACCVVGADDPVQAREDRDAVAAAVENLLLAAHARGLAGMWRTGTMADAPEVREALGLGPSDAVVAFVYLGVPLEPAPARPAGRRDIDEVAVWRGW